MTILQANDAGRPRTRLSRERQSPDWRVQQRAEPGIEAPSLILNFTSAHTRAERGKLRRGALKAPGETRVPHITRAVENRPSDVHRRKTSTFASVHHLANREIGVPGRGVYGTSLGYLRACDYLPEPSPKIRIVTCMIVARFTAPLPVSPLHSAPRSSALHPPALLSSAPAFFR